jgi:Trypsin
LEIELGGEIMSFIDKIHALANKRGVRAACAAMTALAVTASSTPAWAITGGANASPGEFPSVVSIQRLGATWSHSCMGAYLGGRSVLTSASCLDGASASSIRAVGGLYDRSNESTAQISNAVAYKVNPNYGMGTSTNPNDIAIVHLDRSFDEPLCPPEVLPPIHWWPWAPQPICYNCVDGDPNAGIVSEVVGWGRTSSTNTLPNILQKGSMEVMNGLDANRLLGSVLGAPQVNNMQMALIDPPGMVTMSNGDGLVYEPSGNGGRVLAGIRSWGISSNGTTLASYPTVTTRVSAYLDWIAANSL